MEIKLPLTSSVGLVRQNSGLLAFGFFVFAATLVATAPASLLAPTLRRAIPDISFDAIEGTLWRAQIKQLRIANVNVGDVSLAANFLSLLTGNLSYDLITDSDALRGAISVSRDVFGTTRIFTKKLEIGPSVTKRYALLGIPVDGTVTMIGASIRQTVARKRRARSTRIS